MQHSWTEHWCCNDLKYCFVLWRYCMEIKRSNQIVSLCSVNRLKCGTRKKDFFFKWSFQCKLLHRNLPWHNEEEKKRYLPKDWYYVSSGANYTNITSSNFLYTLLISAFRVNLGLVHWQSTHVHCKLLWFCNNDDVKVLKASVATISAKSSFYTWHL